MLTIRKEQVAVLDGEMARQFELKMMTLLRHKFAAQTEKQDDEEILAEVRHGVKTSAKYGISAECDVARYIEYMMIYGLNFDTDSKFEWAGKVLKAEGINGAQKLDRIDEHDQMARSRA